MKKLLPVVSLLGALSANYTCEASPHNTNDPCYNPNLMSASTRDSWEYRANLCHELTMSIRPRLDAVLLAQGFTPNAKQRRLMGLRIADRIAYTLNTVAESVSFGYGGASIVDHNSMMFNPFSNLQLVARRRLRRAITPAQTAVVNDFDFLRDRIAHLAEVLPQPTVLRGNPARALDIMAMDLVAGMHNIPPQVMKGFLPESSDKHR